MNRTFAIIKPDAITKGFAGEIINKTIEAGFEIVAMKTTKISIQEAQNFYAIHKEKPFFEKLTTFMSSGKIIVMALEKNNAVENFRETIGATNPEEAKENTIRKLYGSNITENSIHGSDSDANAEIETNFFFTNRELI